MLAGAQGCVATGNSAPHDDRRAYRVKTRPWDGMRLLHATRARPGETSVCRRLVETTWGAASLRDVLWHELLSEYDAVLFSAHLDVAGVRPSPAFEQFHRAWLPDELRHHAGFRFLIGRMFGVAESTVDAAVAARLGAFSAIEHFLHDELRLCVLLAYDEIVTAKAYARDYPIYDSFGDPSLSRWIRLVARDEIMHFGNLVRLVTTHQADRLHEVPALVEELLARERTASVYEATFVLDHQGYPEELLSSAAAVVRRVLRATAA